MLSFSGKHYKTFNISVYLKIFTRRCHFAYLYYDTIRCKILWADINALIKRLMYSIFSEPFSMIESMFEEFLNIFEVKTKTAQGNKMFFFFWCARRYNEAILKWCRIYIEIKVFWCLKFHKQNLCANHNVIILNKYCATGIYILFIKTYTEHFCCCLWARNNFTTKR